MFLELELGPQSARIMRRDDTRWRADDLGSTLRLTPAGGNPADRSIVEVIPGQAVIRRAFSGEQALYCATRGRSLFVSDRVIEIADHLRPSVNLDAAYSYIYFEYPGQGKTLFAGVREVLNAQTVTVTCLSSGSELQLSFSDSFVIPSDELRDHTVGELSTELRTHVTNAHRARATSQNGVLLSGGIDSQVVSIALVRDLGLKNTFAVHFSELGATESEVQQAHQVATQLGMEWNAVEVDTDAEVDWAALVRANNPYVGALSMRRVLEKLAVRPESPVTLFAGQDTRLHTPALSKADLLLWDSAFRISPIARTGAAVASIVRRLLDLGSEHTIGRILALAANSPSFAEFLANRSFHVRRLGFNEASPHFHRLFGEIVAELNSVRPAEKRRTYNRIVAANWRRQYLFDIGYMVQSCEDGNAGCAMPFYDRDLATFSATLPFALATRFTRGRAGHADGTVRVNKYLLRKAYENDLDRNLIFRDKAVCKTAHMFFNGGLKRLLEKFVQNDEIAMSPEGRALHLPEIQAMCQRKHGVWRLQDSWLCNIAFNALVVSTLLGR